MEQPTRLGRYRLYKKLAASAVLETWIARPVDADAPGNELIVRKLTQRLRQSGDILDLLRREVEVAASLVHPNIARTFEFGQADGRDAYIAAEYVWGEDLRRIAERGMTVGRFLSVEHAVRVVADVAEALAYLHEKRDDGGNPLRLVHGDVSPSNVLVSFSGRVKVVEAGLAAAEQKASELVQPGRQQAKYAYMSPEQVQGLDIDARSDLFSLGTVLYELTTRKRLFKGSDEVSTMKLVSEAAVKAPSESIPSYPPALERIVLRALARDPGQRYARAVELRADLLGFLDETGSAPRAEDLAEYMRGVFPDRLKELENLLGEGYAGPTGDVSALLGSQRPAAPAAPASPPPPQMPSGAPIGATPGKPKSSPPSKAGPKGDMPPLPRFNAPSASGATPVVSRAAAQAPPARPAPAEPAVLPVTPLMPPPAPAAVAPAPPPETRFAPEPLSRADEARTTAPEERPIPPEARPSGPLERPLEGAPAYHAEHAFEADEFRPPMRPAPDAEAIDEPLPPPVSWAPDREELGSGPHHLDRDPTPPPPRSPASPRPRASRVTTAEHTLRKDKPEVHEQMVETSGKVMRWAALALLAAVGLVVWYGTTYGWPWDEARLGGGVERRRPEVPPPPDLPATMPVQVRSEPAGAAVAVNGVIQAQRTPAAFPVVAGEANTFAFYMDGFYTQIIDVPVGITPPSQGVSVTLEPVVQPEGWTPPPPDPTSDAPPITEWSQPRGHLTVTTEPVGATILINGVDVCRSPCEEVEVFADQELHVTARLEGYLDAVAFPVAPPWDYRNDTKFVELHLRQPPEGGQIYTYFQITSVPDDATVSINGQEVGRTEMNVPRRVDMVTRLEMRLIEHELWGRTFYPGVGSFEVAPILSRIRREPAQLTLLIDTPGFELTKIYLRPATAESANEIGTGSVQVFQTESGSYELTLSHTPPPETGLPRQRSRVTLDLPPNQHVVAHYAWDGNQFTLTERSEGPLVEPPEQPRP